MTPIQINVAISLGLTPRLNELVQQLVNLMCEQRQPISPAAKAAPVVEEPQPEAVAPAVEEPQPEAVAPAENAVIETKHVLEAIRRARTRIEGEDWSTNLEGEGRAKWHNKITQWAKGTARLLGADSPKDFQDQDTRRHFINLCDNLTTKDDELFEPVPF